MAYLVPSWTPSWPIQGRLGAILGHLGRSNDPRPGHPDPRGGGRGKGNPLPEGEERGLEEGKRGSLNHSRPKGLVGLQDALPHASHMYEKWRQSGAKSTSVHAWVASFQKMQDRRARVRHPVDALGPCIQRYVAWTGCSTSSVERGLGHLTRILGKERTELDVRSQVGELKLHTDIQLPTASPPPRLGCEL